MADRKVTIAIEITTIFREFEALKSKIEGLKGTLNDLVAKASEPPTGSTIERSFKTVFAKGVEAARIELDKLPAIADKAIAEVNRTLSLRKRSKGDIVSQILPDNVRAWDEKVSGVVSRILPNSIKRTRQPTTAELSEGLSTLGGLQQGYYKTRDAAAYYQKGLEASNESIAPVFDRLSNLRGQLSTYKSLKLADFIADPQQLALAQKRLNDLIRLTESQIKRLYRVIQENKPTIDTKKLGDAFMTGGSVPGTTWLPGQRMEPGASQVIQRRMSGFVDETAKRDVGKFYTGLTTQVQTYETKLANIRELIATETNAKQRAALNRYLKETQDSYSRLTKAAQSVKWTQPVKIDSTYLPGKRMPTEGPESSAQIARSMGTIVGEKAYQDIGSYYTKMQMRVQEYETKIAKLRELIATETNAKLRVILQKYLQEVQTSYDRATRAAKGVVTEHKLTSDWLPGQRMPTTGPESSAKIAESMATIIPKDAEQRVNAYYARMLRLIQGKEAEIGRIKQLIAVETNDAMKNVLNKQLQDAQVKYNKMQGLATAPTSKIDKPVTLPLSDIDIAKKKIADIYLSIKSARNQLPIFEDELRRATRAGDQGAIVQLRQNIERLTQSMHGVSAKSNMFRNVFSNFGAFAKDFTSHVKEAIYWQAKWYGAKFLLFEPLRLGSQAIQDAFAYAKLIDDWTAKLTRWEATTGKVSETHRGFVKGLVMDMRKLTMDLAISFDDLAKSTEAFISAGLSINTVRELLPTIAQLKIAFPEVNMEQMAPALVGSWNTFRKTLTGTVSSAEQLKTIFEQMMLAQAKGVIRPEQFTQVLQHLGEMGRIAGFDTKQLFALAVAVTDFGSRAGSAARSLRGMIDTLAKDGKKAQIEAITGFKFDKSKTIEQQFIPMMLALRKVVGEGTKKSYGAVTLLTDIFSVERLKSATAIMDSIDKYIRLQKLMENSQDSLALSADIMSQRVSGQLTILGNRWKELSISVADSTGLMKSGLVVLNDMIAGVAQVFNSETLSDKKLGTAGNIAFGTFSALIAPLQTVVILFKGIASILPTIIDLFLRVMPPFSIFINAIRLFGASIPGLNAFVAAIMDMNTAISLLARTITTMLVVALLSKLGIVKNLVSTFSQLRVTMVSLPGIMAGIATGMTALALSMGKFIKQNATLLAIVAAAQLIQWVYDKGQQRKQEGLLESVKRTNELQEELSKTKPESITGDLDTFEKKIKYEEDAIDYWDRLIKKAEEYKQVTKEETKPGIFSTDEKPKVKMEVGKVAQSPVYDAIEKSLTTSPKKDTAVQDAIEKGLTTSKKDIAVQDAIEKSLNGQTKAKIEGIDASKIDLDNARKMKLEAIRRQDMLLQAVENAKEMAKVDKMTVPPDISETSGAYFSRVNSDLRREADIEIRKINDKQRVEKEKLDNQRKLNLMGEDEYQNAQLAQLKYFNDEKIKVEERYQFKVVQLHTDAMGSLKRGGKNEKQDLANIERDAKNAREDSAEKIEGYRAQNTKEEMDAATNITLMKQKIAEQEVEHLVNMTRLRTEHETALSLNSVEEQVKQTEWLYQKNLASAKEYYDLLDERIKIVTDAEKERKLADIEGLRLSTRTKLEQFGGDPVQAAKIWNDYKAEYLKLQNDLTLIELKGSNDRAEIRRKQADDVKAYIDKEAFKKAFTDLRDQLNNSAVQWNQLGTELGSAIMTGLNDSFFNIVQGKFENLEEVFNNMLDNMLKALINFATNQIVLGFLGALLPTAAPVAGPDFADLSFGTRHKGGKVISLPTRHEGGQVIPRFHSGGLNADERVVINKVGERYITKEQNEWLTKLADSQQGGGSNVQVNVINQSSQKVNAKQSQPRFDGRQMIVDVVLSDLQSNGPIYRTLSTRR